MLLDMVYLGDAVKLQKLIRSFLTWRWSNASTRDVIMATLPE